MSPTARPSGVWSALAVDVSANIERPARALDIVLALLWSRGVQAVLLYRIARRLHAAHLTPLSEILLRISQLVFTVDLHYTADAAPGLVLRHPSNVVVGRGVSLGRNVVLFQGTTLGNRLSGGPDRPDGMPVLEDDVQVYAGAKVLGPVTVGRGSRIGANVVLTESCPPGSRVVGVAPRILARGGSEPGGANE